MSGNYFQGAPVIVNSATTLAGVQKAQYNPNSRLIMPDSDGRAVKTLATLGLIQPAVEIDTLNLAQVYGLLAASGELPYVALTDLKWFGRKVATAGPGFAAGNVHEQGHATLGSLFLTGIDANANAEATAHLMALLASSDGSTHPVDWSQVAAPSDPLTIAPFVLDSASIDGTNVDELVSVSIALGVQSQIEHGAKPYPRLVRPRMVDWSLTVRHNDLTIERSKVDKAAAISAVFKSIATGGPTRGTGTFTVTVTGLVRQGGSERGASGNAAVTTVCHGRHDGVNMPATWSYTP